MIGGILRALRPVLALCLLLLAAAPANAQTSYQSEYQGGYFYSDGRPGVPILLQVSINSRSVSGRVIEPATFGDGTSTFLFANVTGVLNGASLVFTKTYDGHGGQSHSVQYSGTLSADAASIEGTWQTDNTQVGHGNWRVVRVDRIH